MDPVLDENSLIKRYIGLASNGNPPITETILQSLEWFFFYSYSGNNRNPSITDRNGGLPCSPRLKKERETDHGRTDGWTNRRTNGRTNGRTDRLSQRCEDASKNDWEWCGRD